LAAVACQFAEKAEPRGQSHRHSINDVGEALARAVKAPAW
jgi:hypothetical protein